MKRAHPYCSLSLVIASAAISLSVLGCSGGKDSPLEKTSPEKSDAANAATGQNATDDNRAARAAAQLAQKVAAPTFVEETTDTLSYADKTPKIVRHVKRYSDNSLVNHGHYVSYYQNGRKFEEGEYADNLKQGPWHVWHEDGKEAKVENFVGGKLDGQWTLFNDKGLAEREVSYKAGRRQGIWKYYYPDGKQVSQQEQYRDDQLDGPSYKWFADGKKSGEFHFQAGQRVGLQQEWYPSGQLASRAEFENGKLVRITTWNEDGSKKQEQEFAEGKTSVKPPSKGS